MPLRFFRLMRARLVAASCLLLLVSTATLHADYRESYRKGIAAVDARRWADVARYMEEAIAERRREGEWVRIYGNRWEPYIPNYYLGLARQQMGDCAGAVPAWRASERQGFIKTQQGEFAILQEGLGRCEARLAASAAAATPEPPRPEPRTPERPQPEPPKPPLAAAPQAPAQQPRTQPPVETPPAPKPAPVVAPSPAGDVATADVRQATATLVLGLSLDGRVFVRNAKQELVVELYKPRGRRVELGLEPGVYEVLVERSGTAFTATSRIAAGERFELAMDQLTRTGPETTGRSGEGPPIFAVAGRHLLEVRVGMFRATGGFAPIPGAVSEADSTSVTAGLRYTRFVREDLAVTFGASLLPAVTTTRVTHAGMLSEHTQILSLPIGVRWNPWPGNSRTQPVKPFLAAGIGPVIGPGEADDGTPISPLNGARRTATVGGVLGGGVDVLLGHSWSVGVSGAYNWMADFPKPIGGRSNFSGFDVGITVGWLFGRGDERRPGR